MLLDGYVGEEKICFGVDIGNTMSTVSFAHFQEDEEPRVYLITRWPGQKDAAGDCKVPTVVSYDPQGRPVHFGTEAVQMDGQNHTTLAKGFKLHLYQTAPRAKNKFTPPPLPSGVSIKTVYTDFLKYLFEHTQNFVSDSSLVDWVQLKDNFVVVMTIPNDWDEAQQAFLRSVVIAAGILPANHESDRLQFVSETDASAHFAIDYGRMASELREGSTFAVCDAGGTTVNTTVYTCTLAAPNLRFKEVTSSECILAGSVFVDEAARVFLQHRLAGSSKYATPEIIQRMVHEFEKKTKRKFDGKRDMNIIQFGRTVDNDRPHGIITGRIVLSRDEVKSLFESLVSAIAASLNKVLGHAGGPKLLLLVGGFSESPYLRAALDERLDTKTARLINIDRTTKAAVAEGALVWFAKEYVVSREITIHSTSEATSRLVDELCTAYQHEKALQSSLSIAQQRLQAVKANVAESQHRGEQKAADGASQLETERRAALQDEEALKSILIELEQRIQTTEERRTGARYRGA